MKKRYFPVEHEGMFWVDVQWRNAKNQNCSEMYCSTITMGRARKIARALNHSERAEANRKRLGLKTNKIVQRWAEGNDMVKHTAFKRDRPSRGLDPYLPGFGRRKR